MGWIPEFDFRDREVHARRDGRLAHDDYTLCPQLFARTMPFTCCITVRPDDPTTHPQSFLWWTPDHKFFVVDSGSAFMDLGRLRDDMLDIMVQMVREMSLRTKEFQDSRRHQGKDYPTALNSLENSLKHIQVRLKVTTYTFRDLVRQVADFQRRYMMIEAFFRWMDLIPALEPDVSKLVQHEVHEDYMGAFCTDPDDVQYLFRVGIPVWYLRSEAALPQDMNIHVNFPFPQPLKLTTEEYSDNQRVDPFPVIYRGPPGVGLLTAILSRGQQSVDVVNPGRTPAAIEPSSDISRSTRSHPPSSTVAQQHRPSMVDPGQTIAVREPSSGPSRSSRSRRRSPLSSSTEARPNTSGK